MSLIKSFQVHYVRLKQYISQHGFDELAQVRLSFLEDSLFELAKVLDCCNEQHLELIHSYRKKLDQLKFA